MVETEILAAKYFYQKIPEFHRDFFSICQSGLALIFFHKQNFSFHL